MRLGEEKRKKKERKKPQGKNIMACPITQGGHNIGVQCFCVVYEGAWKRDRKETEKYSRQSFTVFMSVVWKSLIKSIVDESNDHVRFC